MCTLGGSAFHPDSLQQNVALLIDLAQHGV